MLLEPLIEKAIREERWKSLLCLMDILAADWIEDKNRESWNVFLKYWNTLPGRIKELFILSTQFGEDWARSTLQNIG